MMTPEARDAHWMERALAMAHLAARRGEVPIGAVVVRDDVLLGSGHDMKELSGDPTGHAEIVALREAAARVGDWRLDGATLYVTLEPCPMCAGALIHARVARLVYGATNVRWAACSGSLNVLEPQRFNHTVEVTGGVLAEECARALKETCRSWRVSK